MLIKLLKILDKNLFRYKLSGIYDSLYQTKLLKQYWHYQFQILYQNPHNNFLGKLCEKYGSDKGYVDIKRNTPFGWKAHIYDHFYTFLFQEKTHTVKKLFECGIGTNNPKITSNMTVDGKPGASLRVWKEYFKNAIIYGADIDKEILFEEDRIKTFYVDQLNPVSIKQLWESIDMNNFDVMIDDGLHTYEAALTLFQNSFKFLKIDGYYIIEDIKFSFLQKLAYELKDYNPYVVIFNDPKNRKNDSNLIYIRKK